MISQLRGSQHKIKELVVDQDHLTKVLKHIFPYDNNSINSRKQSALRYPSGSYLELDFWIPNLNLCFEFQDKYHYVTAWYHHRVISHVQRRDNYKVHTAHKQGISMVVVPCWWDGSADSLVATIQFQRPDILSTWNTAAFPISCSPPKSFFFTPEIPGVGELMVASFPKDNLFPNNDSTWWMGEKYDGVRCCWNALEKQLYTRAGNKLSLLPELYQFFPQHTFIDAEVWLGKRNFYQAQRIASGGIVIWDTVRVTAFDVPSQNLNRLPFESRYSHLLAKIPPNSPLIIVSPRLIIQSADEMERMVSQMLEGEGEGIIMRMQFSLYENGRSRSLIKLKGSTEDKEGIVIEKSPDKSVVLKLANGVIFSVPFQNVYVNQISIGDVVTFSYKKGDEYANATIYQIRTDVSWPEVVQNDFTLETETNGPKSVVDSRKINAKRSWTESTMRLYLENVARKRNLDPLLPETWYNISPASIHKTEKGASVLGHFKGGYVSALMKLFPNIGLNFTDIGSYYSLLRLKDFANRRKFCENYAKTHNFDPYNPEHWYKQSKDQFLAFKGAKTMLRYYRGNLPKALMNIFPDIGLQRPLLYALLNFTPQYADVLQKYKSKNM